MRHAIPASKKLEATQHAEQTIVPILKPSYHPPRMVVYGTVTRLTKGSGGEYDDECTSGKWPGSDE